MEILFLKDPMIYPDDDVLEAALGKKFKTYQKYADKAAEMGLILEWNYYKDGNDWLCKTLYKKKNMCWLGVFNASFKITFYFTDKTIDGVFKLDIADEIKKAALEMKPVGKLRPVSVLISSNKILDDVIKILKYKMELK